MQAITTISFLLGGLLFAMPHLASPGSGEEAPTLTPTAAQDGLAAGNGTGPDQLAPTLTLRQQRVVVALHEWAPFAADVTNPDPAAQEVTMQAEGVLEVSVSWNGTVRSDLPFGVSTEVAQWVTPLAPGEARVAEGRVYGELPGEYKVRVSAFGADAYANAVFSVCVEAPLLPCTGDV